MKILITGSSGRVGSAIASSLVADHQIFGLDLVAGTYTSHVMDLLGPDVKVIAECADAIIHCAASHAKHLDEHSDQEFWDNNVETTRLLLKHSRPTGPFVLTSSTSVYGDAMNVADNTVWVDELLEPQPRDIYDVTKLAAEKVLYEACLNGRVGTVLRMSRCFPEPEPVMALYRLYRGVDIRDVVHAHWLALRRTDGFEKFVISGPNKFERSDIAQLSGDAWSCIKSYYPAAAREIERRNWPQPNFIDRVYSSAFAAELLAYKPKFGIDEFLAGDRAPSPNDQA